MTLSSRTRNQYPPSAILYERDRLRAALEEIINSEPKPNRIIGGKPDWFTAWKELAFHMKGIARKALEKH